MWINGLASLFYPTLCLSCRRALPPGEDLCLGCAGELPWLEDGIAAENRVTERLAGRLPLVCGLAGYAFRDGNMCQRLVHTLKYRNRADLGRSLGRRLGRRFARVESLSDVDGIVPVPISKKRRHRRGYNQAEELAAGMAEVLNVPVYPDALRRVTFRGSQTKRDRLARMENTERSFGPGRGDFAGRHLLLVDDVLTTGATLDYCGQVLLRAHEGVRLSVAVLALAARR